VCPCLAALAVTLQYGGDRRAAKQGHTAHCYLGLNHAMNCVSATAQRYTCQ